MQIAKWMIALLAEFRDPFQQELRGGLLDALCGIQDIAAETLNIHGGHSLGSDLR